jgi:DNA-damage-inducible protein D
MDNRLPRMGVFAFLREDVGEMGDDSIFEVPTGDQSSFESMAFDGEDGRHFWWQSDLMTFLGYQSRETFSKPVGKAMSAVSTLGLSTFEGFRPAKRTVDGGEVDDCQLSRFACYLIAMNGDPRKPEIAAAQAYFTAMTEVARQAMLNVDKVERLILRDNMADAEKAMSSTAKRAGVNRYDIFRSEGYRGMYDMALAQLKSRKGVDADCVLADYMGRQELAANVFRVSETEAKVRNQKIKGDIQVQRTAFEVGRVVRKTMIETSGTRPEDLPAEEDIAKVRSRFKKAAKGLENMDKPKRKLPPTQ